MQSTEKVKSRLESIQKEIGRLNELYFDDPEIGSKKFFFRNGKQSEIEGHTFNLEMTRLVTEKMTLKWVLGIKD